MSTPVIIAIVAIVIIVIAAFALRSGKKTDRTGTSGVSDVTPPHSTAELEEKAQATATAEPEPIAAPADEAVAESAPAVAQPEPEPEPEPEPDAPRVFERPDVKSMRRGLARSRADGGIFGRLKALFSDQREIGADVTADIEEVLITSDVGVQTTQAILERVRDSLNKGEHSDPERVWAALRAEAGRILSVEGQADGLRLRKKPTVILMVGVNGAGKTTTIGKLATRLKAEGKRCVLAAGDTFRAAAVQQLEIWGNRVGFEVIKGAEGADPASVIFDAVKKAEELGVDVVLADTAGRLHTKTNLMNEMEKIVRTAGKALNGAPHEILLVLDATNGQNALAQAREFCEALPLTGLVLTKLDGTAKGGVVLGICDSLKLPVRFVGLGERASDLHEFAPSEFVEALLGRDNEANAA
jgi:fused signal recognition particle receptor